MEATDICLPGFTPIFCAVEQGNVEFWELSTTLFRRLARLKEKMQGVLELMLNVGYSLLSVAGTVGMALAVRQRQLVPHNI